MHEEISMHTTPKISVNLPRCFHRALPKPLFQPSPSFPWRSMLRKVLSLNVVIFIFAWYNEINGMKEPPTFFSSPLNANQQSIEQAKPKAVRIVIFQRNRKIKITYSHGSSPTRRRSSSLSVNTSCHPSFWSNWPSNLNMEANPHLNSA